MPDSPLPTDDAMLFFREVVEPTVAEFMTDRSNKRRGCLACLAVASMTEHYFHARSELASLGKAEFKAKVRKEDWAVGAIADVANATKHVLGHSHRGKWGYDDVSTHQLNTVGTMRAGWPVGGREVLIGSDRAWRLSILLNAAVTFWQAKLAIVPTPGAEESGID
jgi:hypothetical protein